MVLTLTKEKCQFSMDKFSFFNTIILKDEVSPDKHKIEAVKNMAAHKNIPELRSFIGFVSYFASFINNFANIADPFIDILQKKKCKWGDSIMTVSWQHHHLTGLLSFFYYGY